MTIGYVYCVTCGANGKKYVGQTVDVHKRMLEHMSPCNSHLPLGKDVALFGRDKFEIEILAECNSRDEMDELERFYIAQLETIVPNGYNVRDGGHKGSVGTRESIERNRVATAKWWEEHPDECAAMSRWKTDQWKSDGYKEAHSGENHYNYGKKMPEHVKARIRDGYVKWASSDEGRRFLSENSKRHYEENLGRKIRRKVECIDTGVQYESIAAAARSVGLKSGSHIGAVCKGRRPIAGGYRWRYVDG